MTSRSNPRTQKLLSDLDSSEFKSLKSDDYEDRTWAEPKQSTVNIEDILKPQSKPKTGYNFALLFIFLKREDMAPVEFLKYFFYVEIFISCVAVIGSTISFFYGITYFTVDQSGEQFNRDNQLIGLTCGVSGVVFSMFKFYFTLISLKNIKKNVFVAEIACAAGLSILTHAVLVVVCFTFCILSIYVGLEELNDTGRVKDKWERDFGILLLITSGPMLLLSCVILGQSFLVKKVSKAVDHYMMDYIHSTKVRRERREARRRARAKEMAAAAAGRD